jgi:hypothetical protein
VLTGSLSSLHKPTSGTPCWWVWWVPAEAHSTQSPTCHHLCRNMIVLLELRSCTFWVPCERHQPIRAIVPLLWWSGQVPFRHPNGRSCSPPYSSAHSCGHSCDLVHATPPARVSIVCVPVISCAWALPFVLSQGDGKTDDSNAVELAFRSMADQHSGSKTVYFPPGV